MMDECQHERTEVRTKTTRNGQKMYGRQCLDCGSIASTWMPKAEGERLSAGPWDENLWRNIFREKSSTFLASLNDTKRREDAEFWERYNAHVNPSNPEWQSRRASVYERERGVCQGCRRAVGRFGFHVHHMTYKHLGSELLFELVLLCETCHDTVHAKNEMRRAG